MSKRKKISKRPKPVKEDLDALGFGSAVLGAWVGGALMIIVYGLAALVMIEGVDDRFSDALFGLPLIVALVTAMLLGAFTRTGRRWGRKFGNYLPLP